MDASEYRTSPRTVLDAVTSEVTARLGAVNDAVTEQTEGVVVDEFVDQDDERPFALWAGFAGLDTFALDRRQAVARPRPPHPPPLDPTGR